MSALSKTIESNVNLAVGSKTVGPVAIDDDVKSLSISITRDNWTNPAAILTANLEVSVAGGPFRHLCGVRSSRSTDTSHGNTTDVMANLPPGTGRTIRATYTLTGARFRATIAMIGNV